MKRSAAILSVAVATASAACGGGDANVPDRSPLADKWLTRARQSYKAGDFEDAEHSASAALDASPQDNEIRILNARIALARLEYAKVLKLTEGLDGSDAHGLRGRAHWYAGDLEQTADELETMLRDPNVKDPWALQISALARRGVGRHPFAMEGSLVGAVEMPQAGPAMIVPCDLEGEHILAMIATASGEVMIDSNFRHDPAWVNLSFGDVEVKDVPALTQDLSGISRQLGAPVKALLGVNLLRHLHVTFDRRGDQFVVRQKDPATPPDASRVPLWYVRGGGMMMRVNVGPKPDATALLLVDSSQPFPLALSDASWAKAGVDVRSLKSDPSLPAPMKAGIVPQLRLGGFDLPGVPAVGGAPMDPLQQNLDIDLGGVLGAGLVSAFRVTFTDGGRYAWLEPDPTMGLGGRPDPRAAQGADLPPDGIAPEEGPLTLPGMPAGPGMNKPGAGILAPQPEAPPAAKPGTKADPKADPKAGTKPPKSDPSGAPKPAGGAK